MPTYVYECPDCNHQFELVQKMTDKPKKVCPKCKKRKVARVPQLTDCIIRLAHCEIKTLGHLAQRNTETMGKYKLSELKEKDPVEQMKKKARENAPWWRPGTTGPNKKLAKMTKKQQKEYIEKG